MESQVQGGSPARTGVGRAVQQEGWGYFGHKPCPGGASLFDSRMARDCWRVGAWSPTKQVAMLSSLTQSEAATALSCWLRQPASLCVNFGKYSLSFVGLGNLPVGRP